MSSSAKGKGRQVGPVNDDNSLDILAGVAARSNNKNNNSGRQQQTAGVAANGSGAAAAVDVEGTHAQLSNGPGAALTADEAARLLDSIERATGSTSNSITTKLDLLNQIRQSANQAHDLNQEYQDSLLAAMQRIANATEHINQLHVRVTAIQNKLSMPTTSAAVQIVAPGTQQISLPWFKHFHGFELAKNQDAEAREVYLTAIRPSPWAPSERKALKGEIVAHNGRWVLEQAEQLSQDYNDMLNSLGGQDFLVNNIDNIDWDKVALAMPRRTAFECRVEWLYNDHPLINRSKWTKEEQERLYDIVETHTESPRNWPAIAIELATSRTAHDCLRQYRRRILPVKKDWTKQEDNLLLEAVRIHGMNWQSIARYVGRHSNACINRWTKTIRPTIKRGKWTPEEDEALRQAYAAVGPVWKQVSARVAGRTDAQCRERWVNVVNPALRPTNEWTEEEEAALLRMRDEEGKSWSEIANAFEGTRTDNHCSRHYANIQRRKAAKEALDNGIVKVPAPKKVRSKRKEATGKPVGRPPKKLRGRAVALARAQEAVDAAVAATAAQDSGSVHMSEDENRSQAGSHDQDMQVGTSSAGAVEQQHDMVPELDPALLAQLTQDHDP